MTDRFLRACRRQPVDRTPVWFMRQAGRYMADYRALRERHSLLELCRTPELATRITLQPVDAIDVDAAIIFSDLLLPFEPMGLAFDFVKGEGPRVEQPLRTEADIERLRLFEPREGLGYVLEAIAMTRRELDGRVPLIGFAGAPFTLASYAIEGGPSRDFARTKALMYGHPEAWHRLCDRLAQVVSGVRRRAGRSGRPGHPDLRLVGRRAVGRGLPRVRQPAHRQGLRRPEGRPTSRRFISARARPRSCPTSPPPAATSSASTGACRSTSPGISSARTYAVQGNLDPTLLLGPRHRMLRAAEDVLQRAAGRPGHIFNLGHGILPASPLEHVQVLARFVHGFRAA